MTKNTDKPATKSKSIQSPSFSIVHTAYSEVSAMSGGKDRSSSFDGSGEGATDRTGKEYECMNRIARIPLVESTALVMSNFYSSVKQSHCVVQTTFENVEEGWYKSAEAVSPVTSKIEETLERPLRVIDSAVCVGLDYVEEKIPSVKLPPKEIYEKSKDYMGREIFAPVVRFTCTFLENVTEKISQYAKSAGAKNDNETTDNRAENDVAKNQK